MILSSVMFYILAGTILAAAYFVVAAKNPLYSAFSLVLTMTGLAGMFFVLNAQFIAAVQLMVYAGAVMVLFVMVVMLFDLKKEMQSFSSGPIKTLITLMFTAGLLGFLVGGVRHAPDLIEAGVTQATLSGEVTRELSHLLFSRYLFAFEALGVLLLLVAVGVVVVSRVKGGTHAKS